MKFTIYVLIFLFSQSAVSASMYKCKDADGTTSYQDRPCEEETISVTKTKQKLGNDDFKKEMIKTLAKMTGKSERELQDPRIRQAAEVLAATDAAKSYAFTKIYGVSAQYCPSVKRDLNNFEAQASDIIKLGKHYYNYGIKANIDGRNLSKSGKELTDGLNKLVSKLKREHMSANQSSLQRKCREASRALTSLARLYSQ